jgi:hypothetical protein
MPAKQDRQAVQRPVTTSSPSTRDAIFARRPFLGAGGVRRGGEPFPDGSRADRVEMVGPLRRSQGDDNMLRWILDVGTSPVSPKDVAMGTFRSHKRG